MFAVSYRITKFHLFWLLQYNQQQTTTKYQTMFDKKVSSSFLFSK